MNAIPSRPLLVLAAGLAVVLCSLSPPATAGFSDPDASAYGEALERTREDWRRFTERFAKVEDGLLAFEDTYGDLHALAYDTPGERRPEAAGELLGWSESEAERRLPELVKGIARLDEHGFEEILDRLAVYVSVVRFTGLYADNAVEFGRRLDPSLAEERVGDPFRRFAAFLEEGERALHRAEEDLPASAELRRWLGGYREAAGTYETALEDLLEGLDAFPRNPLCGRAEQWRDARLAFLNASVSREGTGDCGAFRTSASYPRLAGVAWESDHDAFLYDPVSRLGYLLPRERAVRVYGWFRLQEDPRRPTPGWVARWALALEDENPAAVAELQARLRRWAHPEEPAREIFELLDLKARLEETAGLPDETFLARTVADTSFALAVAALVAAHDGHVLLSGRVVDAHTREPLAGATVSLSAGPEAGGAVTDSTGSYRVVFPGGLGDLYRATVTREGYEVLTQGGSLIRRVQDKVSFSLNRSADGFLVTGHVFRLVGDEPQPVEGAVVTAGSGRGTRAKVETGPGGEYRLALQVPGDYPVEIRAVKGAEAAGTRVSALGDSRTGVDLYLAEDAGAVAGAGDGAAAVAGSAVAAAAAVPAETEAGGTEAGAYPGGADGPEGVGSFAEAVPDSVPYEFVPEDPPFTQTSESGQCSEDLLALDLLPGSFPGSVRPGETYAVEADVRYEPRPGRADTVSVLVKAFFFDAVPQETRLVFTAGGVKTVRFEFETDEMDLGHPEGRVGIGAGAVLRCADGTGSEHVTTALQGFRKAPLPPEALTEPE